ncbi:alpha/beta fold hydrolase [Ulvibacter litoralis]|uniref:alpha/beta fold hydrolase n=1 Tax=Ulvibacter litoralis TaxID=227084 RepID=UPI001E4B3EF9|nr:alpha/beta hydrolase [Ulvibacter litoralis]
MSSTSCTVLQWRKSDQEIQKKFNHLEIESKISYVEVDSLDLKIRIQEIKSEGKNVNLVFIHGAPSSLSTWDGYLTDATLKATANMYAVDRPGYGYSNFGTPISSIDDQAQLMSAIINDKKLKNIIVIGSSYGGPIAARVGVLNANVKAVVMISPAIDPTNEKHIWASRFTQWKLTRWLVPTAYRVAGDEKKVHAKELSLIENDWKNLTIPILHIHGNTDNIVPYENIHYSEKTFQNIEVISISEKGHELAWKDSEFIINLITKRVLQIQKEN